MIIKKRTVNSLIAVVSLFMFAYLPTSYDSEIFGNWWIIGVELISLITALTLLLSNKVNVKKITILFTVVISYLILATLIMLIKYDTARISIARYAPIVVLFIFTSVKIDNFPHRKLMNRLFDLLIITMMFWNLGILSSNSFIHSLTHNFYSQYYELALYYSLIYNKTVMSFGVHNYASYYYLIMFMLSYYSFQHTKKVKYLVYQMACILFTIFLTSNSSLIYATIMVFILLKYFYKKIIPVTVISILLIFVISSNVNFLSESYARITTSEINGIAPRYFGDNNIFKDNFLAIKGNLGIGFTIIDELNLDYSDSGYVLYYTMGKTILLFVVYYSIIDFVVKNVDKEYRYFFLFTILSFEVALPATFQYRFLFSTLFVVYYLKSIKLSRIE